MFYIAGIIERMFRNFIHQRIETCTRTNRVARVEFRDTYDFSETPTTEGGETFEKFFRASTDGIFSQVTIS